MFILNFLNLIIFFVRKHLTKRKLVIDVIRMTFLKVNKNNSKSPNLINIKAQMKFDLDQRYTMSKKNTYQYNVENDRKIRISSNFDGGNILMIKQVT